MEASQPVRRDDEDNDFEPDEDDYELDDYDIVPDDDEVQLTYSHSAATCSQAILNLATTLLFQTTPAFSQSMTMSRTSHSYCARASMHTPAILLLTGESRVQLFLFQVIMLYLSTYCHVVLSS